MMIKTKTFQVSVILPVYNAEKYLENAVDSALFHDCVKEVILVEDASPDNALELCQSLEKKHKRIKLYRHPNGENRGAGASRNLGIEKATSEYIAFLDADDWYETNRFDAEKEILTFNSNIDGVYGATGFYYENNKNKFSDALYSFNHPVNPENVFQEIIRPKGGRFSTNAITVKKKLIEKVGGFDDSLRLHQDSHLWLKLAYYGKLMHGIIDVPITYYRQHDENRFAKANRNTAIQYHRIVYDEYKNKSDISKEVMRILFKNVIINQTNSNNNIIRSLIAVKEVILCPKIILKIL